jgi:hypothetical protein
MLGTFSAPKNYKFLNIFLLGCYLYSLLQNNNFNLPENYFFSVEVGRETSARYTFRASYTFRAHGTFYPKRHTLASK